MKCFECGGGIIQKNTSFVMYEKDGKPVFFEDVSLGECEQCGEKYFNGVTLEKIDRALKGEGRLSKREIKVPVVSLVA